MVVRDSREERRLTEITVIYSRVARASGPPKLLGSQVMCLKREVNLLGRLWVKKHKREVKQMVFRNHGGRMVTQREVPIFSPWTDTFSRSSNAYAFDIDGIQTLIFATEIQEILYRYIILRIRMAIRKDA
jgi:hypothetical protein